MPRPPVDLSRKIKDILGHVEDLPEEAAAPLSHYKRSAADIEGLLEYVRENFKKLPLRRSVARHYLVRLNGMALVHLIENFERFLKEVAAACVDCLARFVLDDRFNTFRVQGSFLAAHFGTDTLGRSLCESAIWLDCDEINARFRKLLSEPFEEGSFHLFPKQNQQPAAERGRYETLSIVWQLRHTVVHNVGVITQSDALKLRLLVKEPVESPRLLTPTEIDLRYLKRFLDETAIRSNARIGERLAELLSAIHAGNPVLFTPQEMADRVSQTFGTALTVAGAIGSV